MKQIQLLTPKIPSEFHDKITIYHGDISKVLEQRGASLIHADPPWTYFSTGIARRDMGDDFDGRSIAHYECIDVSQIIRHLEASYDSAADDAYLFCWSTWPLLAEFMPLMLQSRWHYLTGGSWHKTGGLGIGFHVRGDSEPWFLFGKGKPKPSGTLTNAWASPRTTHSEKPVEWLAKMIEALTEPDALVLSLYSGMCPEARAAKKTGRRLIGAEIDAERWAQAISRLQNYWW